MNKPSAITFPAPTANWGKVLWPRFSRAIPAALFGREQLKPMEARNQMIELGRKYKDKVTGFEGTATGHANYISGCSQVLLAPTVTADGAHREGQWFDEQRLTAQGDERITLDNATTPGCDRAAPKR